METNRSPHIDCLLDNTATAKESTTRQSTLRNVGGKAFASRRLSSFKDRSGRRKVWPLADRVPLIHWHTSQA
jgi:hypothetical protein